MKFPKYQKSNQIGEQGITILKEIIETDLNWIFRPNHLEHDFGIDAYIDVVSENGSVTGKSIALQVKAGDSYFKEENEIGWVFRGQMAHLNYYLNHDIPVLIVLVDISNKKAFWCHCNPNKTIAAGENWKIYVPSSQELNAKSKKDLEKFISPIKDYASQLEYFWKTNKLLNEAGMLSLLVDKNEIEKGEIQHIKSAFERLESNPDLLLSKKGKVDIWINGYDNDSRELYEIKEITNWVQLFMQKIKGWSFFLSKEPYATFLRVIQLSNMDYEITNETRILHGRKQKKIIFDFSSGVPFLETTFEDLNTFCMKHNISEKSNIKITDKIMKYLSCE